MPPNQHRPHRHRPGRVRLETKAPSRRASLPQVTGEPRAVKATLQEIATVLEKSDAWTRDVVRDAVLAVLAAVLALNQHRPKESGPGFRELY